MGRALLTLLLLLPAAWPTRAQVPDTTRADTVWTVPADTAAVDTAGVDTSAMRPEARMRRPPGPPLPYAGAERGTPLHRVPPAVQPALDATELLADWPGSFRYAFGTVGWPDGWSPEGLGPHHPALLLGGLPFDDPVTGRPRYDLLPLAWLEPLRVAPVRLGTPYAALARLRSFPAPEPLTVLRYRTRGNGLQSIMALHVQQRRLTLFGTPGIVQITGGYGGHANDGAYAGSRLRRGRQLLGRLRYAHPRWSIELTELHNRRHLGAHAGVEPAGADYATVFDPATSVVREPSARRQTIRNDLSLTARLRTLAEPLTATALWTAQTTRYLPGTDTIGAHTDRLALHAYQDVALGGHHLRLRLEARRDRLVPEVGLADTSFTNGRLTLAAADSTRLLGFDLVAEAAWHRADDLPPVTGRLTLGRGTQRRLALTLVHAGRSVPYVARHGFGTTIVPLEGVPTARILRARLEASAALGALDLAAAAFAHRLTDALDYALPEADAPDVIEAVVPDEPVTRLGASLELGLRRHARRGFYGWAGATTYTLPKAPAAPDPARPDAPQLLARLAAALPEATAHGRLGARYALFRGDLDLDVYLQGRAWSAFRSRAFHAPTALFALPPAAARTLGPSGVLDLFVEAGIRTATLFLTYEHLLAGRAYAGTLLVPDYPLPGPRFRIGVHWPITG